MAWETRGNGCYYYRKRRFGQTVTSVYHGNGPVAELLSILDELERERRIVMSLNRLAQRIEWEADQDLDRALDEVADLARALKEAVLLANGCYQHRRQWRKRRDE